MNPTLDLSTLLTSIVGTSVSGGVGYIIYQLSGIKAHLAALNGSVGQMKQWQTSHDELDKVRFANIEEKIKLNKSLKRK